MSVPSVRPTSVEITLGRGSDRLAEPIDLKIMSDFSKFELQVANICKLIFFGITRLWQTYCSDLANNLTCMYLKR